MSNKIGMFGGSFNPLHLGHVNDIVEASTMCDKLYVILSYSLKRDEIDYHKRFEWLKNITSDMENVEVLSVSDDDNSKEVYNWQKGANDIKKLINDHIDIVFCGSDYKGLNVFERLYKDSNIHYFDRRKINISSTQIRRNPYIYFEYLPKIVQQYFLKKIVIIGTESCGKSTLVRNLAKIYNTVYVQEVGRIICDEAGGIDNMKAEDFIKIFIKHKALEMEQEKYANKVLFIDTEAIVTLYYLGLQCGDMDLSMINNLGNSIANLNNYDLYIFLEPDVKWIQDGTRTYGEDETRQKNNLLLKQMLQERGITYEVINGGYHERFEKTKKLINMLI